MGVLGVVYVSIWLLFIEGENRGSLLDDTSSYYVDDRTSEVGREVALAWDRYRYESRAINDTITIGYVRFGDEGVSKVVFISGVEALVSGNCGGV